MIKKDVVPSQMLPVAVLLTLMGGFFDAYTYLSRGGVFANAQTGNIIKLAMAMANKQYDTTIRFMIPICFFIAGVYTSGYFLHRFHDHNIPFTRRAVLCVDMVLVIIIGTLPQSETFNIVANVLVSFICAMQMETFKTFLGIPMATVIATGNLRNAIGNLHRGIMHNNEEEIQVSLYYFFQVILFVAGVYIGTLMTNFFGVRAILVTLVSLIGSFLFITFKYQEMTTNNSL